MTKLYSFRQIIVSPPESGLFCTNYAIVQCFRVVLVHLILLFTLSNSGAMAQDTEDLLAIEETRQKTLENFNVAEIPDFDRIRSVASELFALPIDQQNVEDLTNLSIEANRAANLIGYIHEEYSDEYRENYRYEFIQKELAKPHDEYVQILNEFIDIRNQVYFNLGIKYKNSGETMKSFLYFNDAFRLSRFDCGNKQPDNCMRWRAEQEMKKLLRIEQIESYVSWQ